MQISRAQLMSDKIFNLLNVKPQFTKLAIPMLAQILLLPMPNEMVVVNESNSITMIVRNHSSQMHEKVGEVTFGRRSTAPGEPTIREWLEWVYLDQKDSVVPLFVLLKAYSTCAVQPMDMVQYELDFPQFESDSSITMGGEATRIMDIVFATCYMSRHIETYKQILVHPNSQEDTLSLVADKVVNACHAENDHYSKVIWNKFISRAK